MHYLISKYLLTAGIVVLVSELAKKNDKLGAFVSAIPIVALLTLLWMYIEKQPEANIANYAYYTFWYVLPTLPMFFCFPSLLAKFGFWPTIGMSVVLTIGVFFVLSIILKQFGIDLI